MRSLILGALAAAALAYPAVAAEPFEVENRIQGVRIIATVHFLEGDGIVECPAGSVAAFKGQATSYIAVIGDGIVESIQKDLGRLPTGDDEHLRVDLRAACTDDGSYMIGNDHKPADYPMFISEDQGASWRQI